MIQEISNWWGRMEQRVQRIQPPQARRFAVAVVGFTVLLIGIVMLVVPGPALVVIPAGLAILALEFAWAKYWLERIKEFAQQAKDKVMPNSRRDSSGPPSGGHRMPS